MLADIASRLKDSIASGAYREAEKLLEEYAGQLESCLQQAGSDGERATLASEAGQLMAWSLRMTTSARKHAHDKLQQIPLALRYESRHPRPPSWQLEG